MQKITSPGSWFHQLCLLVLVLAFSSAHAVGPKPTGACRPEDLARTGAAPAPRKTDHLLPVAETSVLPADKTADVAAFLAEKEYRVATYNVENFFSSVGSFKPDPKTGKRIQVKPADIKPEKDRKGVAKAILDMNPDVATLQEAELNATAEFCEQELGGKYTAMRIRGNDGRGIDVVVIVKKGSPLEFTYHSHKNEPFSNPLYPDHNKVFSRDVTALVARLPGHDKPLFVLLGLHGKSKRTETDEDPESNQFREAQGDRTADIAQYYLNLYGAPVIIGGDFNDSPHRSKAYRPVRDMGFKDAFDVSKGEQIPQGDVRRISHSYHPRGGAAHYDQLDALMMSPNSQELVLGAEVYQYIDDRGRPMPIPKTYEERDKQPSDHRPVWMRLDRQALLKLAGIIK